MIKAIALDDEPLALEILKHYSETIEGIVLEKTFTSQKEAVKYLNKFDVDLLFLDIEMPGLNGIELYKSLHRSTKVIFTTAFSEYAVEGFNVNAVDYLLKPIALERFEQAVQKAIQMAELENNNENRNTHLSIRADYKLHQIPLETILFIEGLDDYIRIHLTNATKITTRSTLKNILQKLPDSVFVRVHRSYIVPIPKITSYYKQSLKVGEFSIPVGATYRRTLSELFQ